MDVSIDYTMCALQIKWIFGFDYKWRELCGRPAGENGLYLADQEPLKRSQAKKT